MHHENVRYEDPMVVLVLKLKCDEFIRLCIRKKSLQFLKYLVIESSVCHFCHTEKM